MPWTRILQNLYSLKLNKEIEKVISSIIRTAYTESEIEEHQVGTRLRNVVETNAIISVVILNNFRSMSLSSVGKIFEKHHATIIHYRSLYEESLCMSRRSLELYNVLNQICFGAIYNYDEEIVKALSKPKVEELTRIVDRLCREKKALEDRLSSIKKMSNV